MLSHFRFPHTFRDFESYIVVLKNWKLYVVYHVGLCMVQKYKTNVHLDHSPTCPFPPLIFGKETDNDRLGCYRTTIESWATGIQPHVFWANIRITSILWCWPGFYNFWRDPIPKNELFNSIRSTLSIIICGSLCMAGTVFDHLEIKEKETARKMEKKIS